MKGVIFTEFLEMLEELVGLEMTNKIIDDAKLKNKGAFTAVGIYPYQEMFKLIDSFSKHAGYSPAHILWSYGEYLYYRLNIMYAGELSGCRDAFSFLHILEHIIRVERLKLYPRAKLILLKVSHQDADTLEVLYRSERKMGTLIEGMISACIKNYPERICLYRENLDPEGARVRFILKKQSHE